MRLFSFYYLDYACDIFIQVIFYITLFQSLYPSHLVKLFKIGSHGLLVIYNPYTASNLNKVAVTKLQKMIK